MIGEREAHAVVQLHADCCSAIARGLYRIEVCAMEQAYCGAGSAEAYGEIGSGVDSKVLTALRSLAGHIVWSRAMRLMTAEDSFYKVLRLAKDDERMNGLQGPVRRVCVGRSKKQFQLYCKVSHGYGDRALRLAHKAVRAMYPLMTGDTEADE